jgi:hypothetical protein
MARERHVWHRRSPAPVRSLSSGLPKARPGGTRPSPEGEGSRAYFAADVDAVAAAALRGTASRNAASSLA